MRSVDDVLELMDRLFDASADRWSDEAGATWWDAFYTDRDRAVPFFANRPDENLVDHVERGRVEVGRALDIGCGTGRNALWLAEHGFDVDAVDLSATAVDWASERAVGVTDPPRFVTGDVLAEAGTRLHGSYDLVYDSGCLHHLPPHRRVRYLQLLDRVLAPGGHFAIVCFAAGRMGTEVPDDQLYLRGGLDGGLAFTDADLRWIFGALEPIELRPMQDESDQSDRFGESFLLTGLFRRPAKHPS